jgi:hypothetical protein
LQGPFQQPLPTALTVSAGASLTGMCCHSFVYDGLPDGGRCNGNHHHQITKLSHSINAIGPAPHRSGKKREHRSIVM